jgi:phage tail protein X
MNRYITIQGDMWDSISKKLYGTEKHVKELMEANKSYLLTLVFLDGIVLNVPEITTEEEISNIPPWRL